MLISDIVDLRETLSGLSTKRVLTVNTDAARSGVRGDASRPFSTISLAKTAAQPGDTIVVKPGNYADRNLLKDGVNQIYEPGVTVEPIANIAGGIFDDSSNGLNGACTCVIGGYGIFKFSAAQTGSPAGFQGCVNITNASSNVVIEALDIINNISNGTSAQRAAVYADKGTLLVRCRRKIHSVYYDAIICGDAAQNSLTVYADEIYGQGDNAVEWVAGDMYIEARYLHSINSCVQMAWIDQPGTPVVVCDNMLTTGVSIDTIYGDAPTNGLEVTARYIASTTGCAVNMNSGLLRLNNARLQGGTNKRAALMSGGTLKATNCTLLKHGTETEAIGGSSGLLQRYMGMEVNGTKGASITMDYGTYPTPSAKVT